MTGHNNGLITLALKEADDAVREQVREAMGEPYRTLLGHFRHESGHYFWDRLVAPDPESLDVVSRPVRRRARGLCGGAERALCAKARRPTGRRISSAPMPAPIPGRISPKAGRIICTSSTRWRRRRAFDLSVVTRRKTTRINFDPHNAASMQQLIDAWLPITFTVNGLNRSMGQPDLYPFILSPRTIAKLAFVHALTHRRPGDG